MIDAVPGEPLAVRFERLGIVLEADGSANEIEGILNPGAARDRHGTLLLYPRMVARGNVSRIGIVRVDESRPQARYERIGFALEPEAAYELRDRPGGFGCEDARVTFVPRLDRYVMAYTAYGPLGPRIALAVSDDAYGWTRIGPVWFGRADLDALGNKDAAFFPEPVRSPAGTPSFAMYHRPMSPFAVNGQTPVPVILSLPLGERESAALAYMPVDDVVRDIGALARARESTRALPVEGAWGVLKNGAGTPPIRTAGGWLSVFHAVDPIERDANHSLYYRAGVVVHDIREPHRVLYRAPEPQFEPQTAAERFGTVNDVVFPTGLDQRAPGVFDVYYGAADARIGLARLFLNGARAPS